MHSAQYSVHCTLHTVRCTVYIVHCTLYSVNFTLYTVLTAQHSYLHEPNPLTPFTSDDSLNVAVHRAIELPWHGKSRTLKLYTVQRTLLWKEVQSSTEH